MTNENQLPAIYGMDQSKAISVLQESLYPGAKADSVALVMEYCRAAGLDPMQKPVHIVPMWDKNLRAMRDVIMPGVNSYRVNAMRSRDYLGISEPEFGPMVEGGAVGISYPEWCKVTVKRSINGQIAEFTVVEYWIENYATAGKDSSMPNAMWKKRPRGQIAKCFDPETEVLTTNGFEKFSAVTGKVIQVTDSGLEYCDSIPFAQDYDGEMIAANGTRLNFMVTPNHDMVTNLGKIEALSMYESATKSADKISIPRSPAFDKQDANVSDDILRLLGYFLADGSHTGHHQFRIAVSREKKIAALDAIDLEWRLSIKKDAGRIAKAGDREILTQYDKHCYTYDWSLLSEFVDSEKLVNADFILALSQRQACIVVESILMFDGSDNGSGVKRLTQKNKNVLGAFELLSVQAGLSVSNRKPLKSDIGSAYSVTVSSAKDFRVVKGVLNNSASLKKTKNTSGKVWCVTVPSGVIVVRRNGFSMICGNCAEAQALRKAFPEIASAPTYEEMEGKLDQSEDKPAMKHMGNVEVVTPKGPSDEEVQIAMDHLEKSIKGGVEVLGNAWKSLSIDLRKSIGAEAIATMKKAAEDHMKPLSKKFSEAKTTDDLYALADVERELAPDELEAFNKRLDELEASGE